MSTKCCKRVGVFGQNMFFRQNVLVYKESFIFQGVTGNILEEDVDLVVTEVIADHFASYETIEQIIPKKTKSKQIINNKMFLSEFLNARGTKNKPMSQNKKQPLEVFYKKSCS